MIRLRIAYGRQIAGSYPGAQVGHLRRTPLRRASLALGCIGRREFPVSA